MILLAREERGVVVFRLWQSLAYERRLGLSVLLVAGGLVLQAVTASSWIGAPFLAASTLLLVVRGYDTRVSPAAVHPGRSGT